jgi:DNA-binding response OmpR family regulator
VRVLVVEDDRTVGQFVRRGLEEAGLHVELAVDGPEGLTRASEGEFDLVVLDLRLPGLSGVELLRTLRDRGVTTPVLVLTAQDALESKVQALRIGADDYVTKPFAFEELLARVEALARRPKAIAPPTLTVADLAIDTGGREVRRAGHLMDPGTNVVDVVINRLRKKVDHGFPQKLIHTVRGVGYVMKA